MAKERTTEAQHLVIVHNKAAVEASKYCACYSCRYIFESTEVVEYSYTDTDYDDKYEVSDTAIEDNAVCPNCGENTVLPDNTVVITPDLIITMEKEWTGGDDDGTAADQDDEAVCEDCDAVYGSEACLQCENYEEDDGESDADAVVPPDDDAEEDDKEEEDTDDDA